MVNVIRLIDCIIGLQELKKESVQLIIADPPYFEIVESDWDNQWETEADYLSWCILWITECHRVLEEGGQLCIWGAVGKNRSHPFIKLLLMIEEMFEDLILVNWITMRNFRVFGNARHFPFARQELLVFSKNKHKTYNKQYSGFEGKNRLGHDKLVTNIWLDCKDAALYNRKNRHRAEKPETASERIVQALSNEGDLVVIPFAGSGSEIKACQKYSRNYIAFEISEDCFEKHLRELV